jgi:hypothetical protein
VGPEWRALVATQNYIAITATPMSTEKIANRGAVARAFSNNKISETHAVPAQGFRRTAEPPGESPICVQKPAGGIRGKEPNRQILDIVGQGIPSATVGGIAAALFCHILSLPGNVPRSPGNRRC